MSRRLGIALSLLVICVAVWMFRGGSARAPAPEPSASQPGAAPAEPETGRPRARSGDLADEGPSAPQRRARRARSNVAAMPFPTRGEGSGKSAGAPAEVDDLEELTRTATEDPDPAERAAAISDLSQRDDLEAVLPVLQRVAADPDPDVKMAVVTALGEFGEAVPLDLLNQFADDPDPQVRLEVLNIVEALSEEDSMPDLVRPILDRATRDRDEEVRDRALELVEWLADLKASTTGENDNEE